MLSFFFLLCFQSFVFCKAVYWGSPAKVSLSVIFDSCSQPYLFTCIFLQVFLYVLFVAQKAPKTPGTEFTIRIKLCSWVAMQHNSVALFSPSLSWRGKFGNGRTRSSRKNAIAKMHRSDITHSFSLFAANNDCCSHSAGFCLILALHALKFAEYFVAKVIPRQRRKVTRKRAKSKLVLGFAASASNLLNGTVENCE